MSDGTYPASGDPEPYTGAAPPALSARRASTFRGSSLSPLLTRRDHLFRRISAKRLHSVRTRTNKILHQSMLTDQWPDLHPASLPVRQRDHTPPPLLPRSLSSLGCKRDPSYKILHDPPTRPHNSSRTRRRDLLPIRVQFPSCRNMTATGLPVPYFLLRSGIARTLPLLHLLRWTSRPRFG